MKRNRRAFGIGLSAAIAIGAFAGSPNEARAGDGPIVALGAGALILVGTDLAFAGHDLDAAIHNDLPRDDWLTVEAIVATPQALAFNAILIGLNSSNERDLASIGTALGLIPTAGVTALTIHGYWGIADKRTDADALAGISVLAGTNFALTAAASGRATAGKLHSRGIGIFTSVLAAPGTAVGIYESTFSRPQQPAWIALTAWSGALFVHGVVSAIVDGDRRDPDPPPEQPPYVAPLQQAAKATFAPTNVVVAPTVLSDGVRPIPGLVATGLF